MLMPTIISIDLLGLVIIFLTLVIWRFITKRDDADGLNKVARNTADVLFWGTALILVFITLVFS